MRCKNCGWPNKPNEKTCVKCHAPLESDDTDFEVTQSNAGNADAPDAGYGRTVREQDVFGHGGFEYADSNADTAADSTKPCPKCGYPLRPGVDKCPNCKFPLNSSSGADAGSGASDYRRTRMDPVPGAGPDYRRPTRMSSDPKPTNNPYRGTVNPYMMNLELEPTFMLKPLKRMNERREPEEQEFEGKEVVLNRDNTEPGNASITSHQQAVVTRIDGHWFIEDKSGQKTTFVQAAKKIELHDGDLILLGNRLFEFHE